MLDLLEAACDIAGKMMAVGVRLVHVSAYGASVRAAAIVADVMAEMRTKGYAMPNIVHVGVAQSGGPVPAGLVLRDNEVTLLSIIVPNVGPDVSLDDVVLRAFRGKCKVHSSLTAKTASVDRYAVRSMRDVVVHEMAHVQAHPYGEWAEELVLRSKAQGINMAELLQSLLVSNVSAHALESPDEFVAEAFVRMYRGDELTSDANAIYGLLQGPELKGK